MSEKYLIVKLSDMKQLVEIINKDILEHKSPYEYVLRDAKFNFLKMKPFLNRIENETGADIVDIVQQLKTLEICPACQIESQEHSCNSLDANKLGRRLSRLVQRANINYLTNKS